LGLVPLPPLPFNPLGPFRERENAKPGASGYGLDRNGLSISREVNCPEFFEEGGLMTLSDAILIVLLADRIHGTDAAIQSAAKRCAKQLPRSQRDMLFKIGNSRAPRELVGHLCQCLPD
jgi:hypothetical protein